MAEDRHKNIESSNEDEEILKSSYIGNKEKSINDPNVDKNKLRSDENDQSKNDNLQTSSIPDSTTSSSEHEIHNQPIEPERRRIKSDFNLNPTHSDILENNDSSSDENEFYLKRKIDHENNSVNYETIPRTDDLVNNTGNDGNYNYANYNISPLDAFRESDSTVYFESETSEEKKKKITGIDNIGYIIGRLFDIDFFYFLFAALIIVGLSFLFRKDSEWIFFTEKSTYGSEIVHDQHKINLRMIGFFIAFVILLAGILSTIISGVIYIIENYFNFNLEHLAIFSSITIQISFSAIFTCLLFILLYKKMTNYQFAIDTKLDFGHVINTLLFATVIFSIKSYVLNKVSLSFDYSRYFKRIRSILIDNYFLIFIKGLKDVTLEPNMLLKEAKENENIITEPDINPQESLIDMNYIDKKGNPNDRMSVYSADHNETSRNNRRTRRRAMNQPVQQSPARNTPQIPINQNIESVHKPDVEIKDKETARLHNHTTGRITSFNRNYWCSVAKKHGNNTLFELLFVKESITTKSDQNFLMKEFRKLKSRDPYKTRTQYKWKNKSRIISKFVLSLARVEQLRDLFCCELFFFNWISKLRMEQFSNLIFHPKKSDIYDHHNNHIISHLNKEKDFHIPKDQIDNLTKQISQEQTILGSSTIKNTKEFHNNKYTVNNTQEVKNNQSTHESQNIKVKKQKSRFSTISVDSLFRIHLNEHLIYKFYERRDRELYFLNKTIEQNNAAVARVSNFLTLVIFLIVLSIFLGISLNKTDKTIDIISALFGTGFILNSTIKDAISSTVFVLCIKPFDVGDRIFVTLDNNCIENLHVTELNVLSTTFMKFDGLYVIVPNTTLAYKSITNIRRSTILSESFYLNVSHSTPIRLLELLKYNISLFLRINTNLFTEFFMFNYHTVEDCNKLTLRVFIQYVENWQEYERYLERKGLFLSFLNSALVKLGIKYTPLVQPVSIVPVTKK